MADTRRGRFQGTPNPRDPRYRSDQPWPIGTQVLVYSGSESDNIEWLQQRYETKELIAQVLDVGQTTFLGYCPIRMFQIKGGQLEEFQWPVDGLIPEDEWPGDDPVKLEKWLDS